MDIVWRRGAPDFDLSKRSIVVDVGCTDQFAHHMVDCFPTITARRGSELNYWIVDMGRRVTVTDFMLLQGVSPDSYPMDKVGVSDKRMGHMLGNAMSCNILERLLPRALMLIGVTPFVLEATHGLIWLAAACHRQLK